MSEKIDLVLSEPIKYAEAGVNQCWTCKHCVGQKEYTAGIPSLNYLGIFPVRVLLPECELVESYMTYTTAIPCEKFEVIGEEYEPKSVSDPEFGKDYKDWYCGNCGEHIDPEYDFYCSRCGKKIKMPEE
jgi:hypothetical protein